MKTLTALCATAALLTLPTTALASTKTAESISACSTEILQQLDLRSDSADLDFRKVKGNSRLQTLSFDIEADGEKDKLTCKVRRDDTVEIEWGETVKPTKVLSVKAQPNKAKDPAASGE